MEIIADSFAEIYSKSRKILLEKGEYVSPKGVQTLEMLDINFVLTNPNSRVAYHPKRKFSLPFAVAESIMLFCPTDKVQYIARLNPRIREFSDDGERLNGSYGYRIALYIENIVNKLKEDPSTRQAVLSIYTLKDSTIKSKDIPCTLTLQFMIRKNRLEMFTNMRSNDLFWGVPYDIFQFTILQEIIANELEIGMGSYHHKAASLHVYTDRHLEMLESIHSMEPVDFAVYYKIIDMWLMAQSVMNLEYAIPEHKNGPFIEILRFSEQKRRKMIPDSLTEHSMWAEKFLRNK